MQEATNSSNNPTPSFAQLGLLNADELRAWCGQHAEIDFLVPGFLPRQPIILACGRSGEGKSPWNLQMAISLDLQVPFLDFPVGKRTTSIICSGEDYPVDTVAQIERQTRHLTGHAVTPPGVLVFSNNAFPEQYNLVGLEQRIKVFRPGVVFIDPVVHFFPNLEDNSEAVDHAYSLLRRWHKQYDAVFVLVHHLTKSLHDNPNYEPLHKWYPSPRGWFDYARGSGAIVQYADVRVGFDTSDARVLHVGGFKRATGNLPLVWMDRAMDPDDGRPLAYSRLRDEALLTPVKRSIYQRLPDPFTPADVKAVSGWKHDSQVHPFLDELLNLGLVTQDAPRQPYHKVRFIAQQQ
jgi:hypothetical protein